MVRPRRKVLVFGFVLMVISRMCGLVLPTSSKYLIDNVINKHQTQFLMPLVLAVLAPLLSKASPDLQIPSWFLKPGSA